MFESINWENNIHIGTFQTMYSQFIVIQIYMNVALRMMFNNLIYNSQHAIAFHMSEHQGVFVSLVLILNPQS